MSNRNEKDVAIQLSDLPIAETPMVENQDTNVIFYRDAYGRQQKAPTDDHEYYLKPTTGRLKKLLVQSTTEHDVLGVPWDPVELNVSGSLINGALKKAPRGFFGTISQVAHSTLIDVLSWTWSSVRARNDDTVKFDEQTAIRWIPSCTALFALVSVNFSSSLTY
jgi:hypothetical protein